MIAAATRIDVFFCDALAPWQRGSDENMNGLLRDYLPKGIDLSVHTSNDLARVAAEVNDRPAQGWAGLGRRTCSPARHPPDPPRTTKRIMKNITSPPALSAFF